MSSPSRGLPVARAKALAADPNTSPAILSQLANIYPETWAILLQNPAVDNDLRSWIQNAVAIQESQVVVEDNIVEEVLNETVQVVPLAVEPDLTDSPQESINSIIVVSSPAASPSGYAARETMRSHDKKPKLRRAKKNSTSRKYFSIVFPTFVIIFLSFLLVSYVYAVSPQQGSLSVADVREVPTSPVWSQSFSQGANSECITFSAKTFDQDLAVILVQNDESDQECRELEDPIASELSLLNTKTGELVWEIDLADEVSWTKDWKKEIVEAPGLNEILVRFIDVNSAEVDKDKTLLAFSRLTGAITDPVLAAQEDKPQQAAPVLEITMIPGNTKDILVFTNAPEDDDKEFQLMRFEARQLSDPTWEYQTDLKPIGGNPIVGDRVVLGREPEEGANERAQAVSLNDGKLVRWDGPQGGKIIDVDGSFIQVFGDGVEEEYNNEVSQAGTADGDGSGRPITISGISFAGSQLWEKTYEGYALTRSGDSINPSTKSSYGQLFVIDNGRTETYPISPQTGESLWNSPLSLGNFLVSKVSAQDEFFIYLTSEGSEFADSVVGFSQLSPIEIGQLPLTNANTRVDGVSLFTGYLVDEPDREEAESRADDGESESDFSAVEEDDPEEMKKIRVCLTAFDLASFGELFTLECNGYEHVALLGGNLVILDRTPEGQLIRSLAQ